MAQPAAPAHTSNTRPKRALIAYCVLAQKLNTPGVSIMQALTPFLAEACRPFSGELFDASQFSQAVAERYDIRIPRLAALGLAEQLANEGLLTSASEHSHSTVYRYAKVPELIEHTGSNPVTEAEVEIVLATFVKFCRTDDRLKLRDDASLHQVFFERLLNADSMRILSRREASISAKNTTGTIVKPVSAADAQSREELHLDFLVSQFLLDLRDRNAAAFERVSDIAFANMAAEAIACFREPSTSGTSLENLTVYFDSPLLLDVLRVNGEYADYGQELLDAVKAGGAKPAVFDHCVAEAESAIRGQLNYLRSGVNKVSAAWGTSATPDLLSALVGNVGDRAEKRLGIHVHRDPEVNLHKRSRDTVGDIETDMNTSMQAWRNEDAKEHDRNSVWMMLAIRDATKPITRICDANWLLLSRNTALVSIANRAWRTWLQGSTKHSKTHIERWTPVAMSDKQFAGYLWGRTGGGDRSITQARLIAHCSAAVRPRADVKARAYNMVLELSGREEADDVAALLEDREGARALMRATKGDPEDVTRERLPFILEKVKLAAGEYAAAQVRAESDRQAEEARLLHEKEIKRVQTEAAEAKATSDRKILQLQEDQQRIASERTALERSLGAANTAEADRKRKILQEGFRAGLSFYRSWRWIVAILFGLASGITMMISATALEIAFVSTVLLAIAGFWFVPNFLDKPLARFAAMRLRVTVHAKDAGIEIPQEPPDFRNQKWSALD